MTPKGVLSGVWQVHKRKHVAQWWPYGWHMSNRTHFQESKVVGKGTLTAQASTAGGSPSLAQFLLVGPGSSILYHKASFLTKEQVKCPPNAHHIHTHPAPKISNKKHFNWSYCHPRGKKYILGRCIQFNDTHSHKKMPKDIPFWP